jgi:hypothetical protein
MASIGVILSFAYSNPSSLGVGLSQIGLEETKYVGIMFGIMDSSLLVVG